MDALDIRPLVQTLLDSKECLSDSEDTSRVYIPGTKTVQSRTKLLDSELQSYQFTANSRLDPPERKITPTVQRHRPSQLALEEYLQRFLEKTSKSDSISVLNRHIRHASCEPQLTAEEMCCHRVSQHTLQAAKQWVVLLRL